MSVSCKVAKRFTRWTRLQAHAEREEGITVIRGHVSSGVTRQGYMMIIVVILLVAILMIADGNAVLGFATVLIGAILYIPLTGDNKNSAVLMREMRGALNAREKPPRQTKRSQATQ